MMWSGVLASLLFVVAESGRSKPDVIQLPVGFFPEGITIAKKSTAYVGSLVDGSIWKGDIRTGKGGVVISDVGGQAVGLDHDGRSGYLFVAGGSAARVYEDDDFSLVAEFVFAGEDEISVINDVYVTETAAYFTDSFQNKLFQVPLDADSGELVDVVVTAANTITLSEEFGIVEGAFNANGIVANDDGSILIVANTNAGQIFTVNPATGTASLIDLGGVPIFGDGLVLRDNTLWVVDNGQNVGGLQQVTEISLSADLTCGSVVPRALTNDLFDTPTTAALKGNSLYIVNAKFGVAPEDVPTTEYEIIRVDRDSVGFNCPSA